MLCARIQVTVALLAVVTSAGPPTTTYSPLPLGQLSHSVPLVHFLAAQPSSLAGSTTNMAATSRLESLPLELFTHVLSYFLNDDEVERAADCDHEHVRGYGFELAILRLNKGIHALAKFYLLNVNTWIRFDVYLACQLV
jgi:hypothetical protein